MAQIPPTSVETLPNELLSHVLSSLSTTDLLPALEVNALFYKTTSAILLRRLRDTFSAQPATAALILECFDDHDRISAPSLSCRYLETTPASRYPTRRQPPPEQPRGLQELPAGHPLRWHSWFRIADVGPKWMRLTRPRRTTPATPAGDGEEEEEGAEEGRDGGKGEEDLVATKTVTIDDGEEDVRLTARVLVEAETPVPFPTHLVVLEHMLPVSRGWLARAAAARRGECVPGGPVAGDARVLWLDEGRNCGVRVGVRSLAEEWGQPVLVGVDELPTVSYEIEYESLVVRSMTPLIALDRTSLETFPVEAGALAVVPTAQ